MSTILVKLLARNQESFLPSFGEHLSNSLPCVRQRKMGKRRWKPNGADRISGGVKTVGVAWNRTVQGASIHFPFPVTGQLVIWPVGWPVLVFGGTVG